MIDGLSGHTEGGAGLAQAIVNTVREPLLVLNSNLRRRCCEPILLPDLSDHSRGERKDACSTSWARANRRRPSPAL